MILDSILVKLLYRYIMIFIDQPTCDTQKVPGQSIIWKERLFAEKFRTDRAVGYAR